jgi:hypothetical protein
MVDLTIMSNQSGKEMRIEDVWEMIQAGSQTFPDKKLEASNTPIFLSLEGAIDQLQQDPAFSALRGELAGYVSRNYRDVLRRLEHLETPSLQSALLKVLCLLQMALKDEFIGNTHPIEYLRDKVIPQLKQVEHGDESGVVKVHREWLERYCWGHELPNEFWEEFG